MGVQVPESRNSRSGYGSSLPIVVLLFTSLQKKIRHASSRENMIRPSLCIMQPRQRTEGHEWQLWLWWPSGSHNNNGSYERDHLTENMFLEQIVRWIPSIVYYNRFTFRGYGYHTLPVAPPIPWILAGWKGRVRPVWPIKVFIPNLWHTIFH